MGAQVQQRQIASEMRRQGE